ncbi:MAG: ZIP family metal transporter [Nanoarchaeota archaeon]
MIEISASVVIYALISVFIVSLISFVGIASLLLGKNTLSSLLLILVSLSAGSLLGGAFIHILPEVVEKQGFSLTVSLLVLAGVVVFFVLDRLIRFHRCEEQHLEQPQCSFIHEPHKHHLGIMNVLGDGVHNFADGLIIAGSYLVSIPTGIATTFAVVLHEVPQELADFGVLLYSGLSKWKALVLNFLSAATAIVGAVVGLILGSKGEIFVNFILPFAAGGFIYIASVNLIPELHRECNLKSSVLHFFFFILGMGLMLMLVLLE